MTPTFPVIELFDRLAVAQVKWEKTLSNLDELTWYQEQIANYDFQAVSELFDQLKSIHFEIWSLEAELKAGHEQQLSLEEIGRRAIKIRDHNKKRIAIKNKIAETLDCPVREIKADHLSQ
jgi:hypothetical protein